MILLNNVIEFLKINIIYFILAVIVFMLCIGIIIAFEKYKKSKNEKIINEINNYIDRLINKANENSEPEIVEENYDLQNIADTNDIEVTDESKTPPVQTENIQEDKPEDIIQENEQVNNSKSYAENFSVFWKIEKTQSDLFMPIMFYENNLILSGNEYSDKNAAKKSIIIIIKNCIPERIVFKENNKKFYFKIVALNKKVVARSIELKTVKECQELIKIIEKLPELEIIIER